MNIKKISLAVAGTFLMVGCASNTGLVKSAQIKPEADNIKPKPVSTVFHRPQGIMTIDFTSDGQLLEITSKGTAPIAGNNAFSIEQASQVATLRARRNISEFLNTQISTTRTTKVLSTAVQKSLEDTTNGMGETVKVDDKDFDANGDPILNANRDGSANIKNPGSVNVKDAGANTNSEKVAEMVKESISTSSTALLKGVVTSSENIDQEGRTIVVEVRTGVKTISASNQLRKLMESAGN